MHKSALQNADRFFKCYLIHEKPAPLVIDIGSQDVNGSIRSVCPEAATYIGVDFVSGKGVDVVLEDPYSLPFGDGIVDSCVSSSVFEHSEMFWLLFVEVMRILKPDGLFYLNAPSNGYVHRYPVDCWRFYPDSANALVTWARRCGYAPAVLESYTSRQQGDVYNDFVAVFIKDASFVGMYPKRIVDSYSEFTNGLTYGSEKFRNQTHHSEDTLKIEAIAGIATGQVLLR